MKLKLHVTETERDYTVETNLFVIIAWERKFKRKVSDLSNGIGMEDLAFMAFECCRQINLSVPAIFDDYIKRLVNIDVVEDEDVNPTVEAVTTAS
jgi:predicted thioredoxin/glutaredoxin